MAYRPRHKCPRCGKYHYCHVVRQEKYDAHFIHCTQTHEAFKVGRTEMVKGRLVYTKLDVA